MTLGNLANAYSIQEQGIKAKNQEAAIAALQLVLKVFTRETFPDKWAGTLCNLGKVYSHRLQGDKAKNLEAAIKAYRLALQVYTFKTFPEDWAKVQYNLGGVYCLRADHYRGISDNWHQNLEVAITAYQLALQVCTPETFPEMWAATQHDLGLIY